MIIYKYSSILSCLLALPLIGALVLALLPAKRTRLIRNSALAVLAGMLAILFAAAALYNWRAGAAPPAGSVSLPDRSGGVFDLWQLRQSFTWLAPLGLHFSLAANGLSLVLMLLLGGANFLAALASYGIDSQVKTYFIMLLLLAALTTGALAATDLGLFCACSALTVLPAYFLAGLWGGEGRRPAAMKFALFGLFGSVAMLAALLAIVFCTRRIDSSPAQALNLMRLTSPTASAAWQSLTGLWPLAEQGAFWLLLAAVATRLGAAAVHLWVPDLLGEAAAPAAMALISSQIIVGAYTLLAVVLPMFPAPAAHYQLILALAAAGGALYAALCALAQSDLRRGIAYWLVAQSGLILLAALAGSVWTWQGAVLLVNGDVWTLLSLLWISHVLERRTGHRDVNRLGGLAQLMPGLFSFSLVGLLSAMATPGLALFPAVLLLLAGLVGAAYHSPAAAAGLWGLSSGFWWLIFAAASGAALVLLAANLLWIIERVFLGRPRPEHLHVVRLTGSEKAVFVILTLAILVGGIFPAVLLLDPIHNMVQYLVNIAAG